MREPTARLQWFLAHVGRILFRNGYGCNCPICSEVAFHGLFVNDEQHARYLYDTECDYNREGTPLRFFDSISERDEWVKTLQK